MKKNKKKILKIVVLISIILIGLFLLCFVLYKNKTNNKLARITGFKTTALSANIMEKSNEIKSYDTITYNLSYKVSGVSGKRDIIITGTLNKNDIKYASWVIPEEDNMSTSFLDNNRVIKILVKNIDANTNYNTKIKLNVTGAPDGYNFDPTFKISDSKNENDDITSNISNQVVTKTISGKLDGENVESVELNLLKLQTDGEYKTYKTTVTDKNGKYTFNDIENGQYKISINNNNIVSQNNDAIIINNNSQKFDIKVVNNNNANIKIDKYIKKIIVNENGKETTYDYNNLNNAVLTLKSVNNLNAKIIYGFRVYNTSNKEAIAKVVKEEIPSGLSYNKDDIENKDWINQDGVLYNRTLSGTTLKDNESKYLQLAFRIVNKNQAEEYINTVQLSADVYHKVIFTDGKNIIDEKVILDADKVEEEPSPLKTGYTFSGWYKDSKYKEKFNFDTYISKDTVIYAKFYKNIKYYSIKFIDQGKDYYETKVEEDKLIDLPKNPTKDGYTFTGWSEDASCENNYDFTKGTSKDLTLYSCYKEKPIIKYDVTFKNSDTDEEYPEYKQEVDEGGVAEEPSETPKVTCKSFDHWSLEKNGDAFNFSTPINKDTVLYAVFTTNELKLTYTHEGEVWEEKTIKCGNKPDLPSNNPTKEGEEFDDWKDDDDNPIDPDDPVDTDKTYHSTFSEIEKPTITHSPTTYVKDKVEVTISTKEGYKTIYKENDNEYKEYNKPFEVYDNETIYAHYKKIKTNEEGLDTDHIIDNFDKEAPVFTSTTIDENKITDTSFTIDNKIIDNLSGMNKLNIYLNDKIVKEYDYSSLSDEEKNKEISESILIDGLASQTTYKLKLEGIDRVGNISETNEVDVSTLNEYVCRVISVNNQPLSEENYMYYRTLDDGMHKSPCTTNSCTIQMLRSVKESNTINNGQNITLDLNGKTITSLDDQAAFTNYDKFTVTNSVKSSDNSDNTNTNINTNKAKRRNAPKINNNDIKIISSDIATITSSKQAIFNYNPTSILKVKDEANVVSTRQEAIYNSGTLQLGEDDFRISNKYPLVKGINFGVKNEGYTVLHPDVTGYDNAELKFYDGVVYGKVSLETKKIETPVSYKTTTKRVPVGQKSYLSILAAAEAEINDVYYKKIEDAFKEAQPGDTIKVLKDIIARKAIIKELDGDLTLDMHGNRVTATRLTNEDGTPSDTYLTLKAKNFTIKNGTIENNDKSGKILNLNLSGDLNINDDALISGDSILNIKGKLNTNSSLNVIDGTVGSLNVNGDYGTSAFKDVFNGTVNGDAVINTEKFIFNGNADKIITKGTSLTASGNIPYIESNGKEDSSSVITNNNLNPTIKLNGGNQTYNGTGTIEVTNATLSGNINTTSDKLTIDEKSKIGNLDITIDKLEVNNDAKKITANVKQSPIIINKDVDELVLASDLKELTIEGKGLIKKLVIPADYNITINNIKVDEIENNGNFTGKNLTINSFVNKNIANIDSSSIEKLHNEKDMNVTLLNGNTDIFNSGVLSVTGNEKDIDLDKAPTRTFKNTGTLTFDDMKFRTVIDTKLHPETYGNDNDGTLNLYNVEIKPQSMALAPWLIYNNKNGIINFGKDDTKKPKLYFYSKKYDNGIEEDFYAIRSNGGITVLNSGTIQNLGDPQKSHYNSNFFSSFNKFKYRDLGNGKTTYFIIANGKFEIFGSENPTQNAKRRMAPRRAPSNNNLYLFEVNNNQYIRLQEAIDAVPENTETTIKILKDFTTEEYVTIPENKNIVLDMNYKEANFIEQDGKKAITNNGTLKILNDNKETKENAKIVPFKTKKTIDLGTVDYSFEGLYYENDYEELHKFSNVKKENIGESDTTCDRENEIYYNALNKSKSVNGNLYDNYIKNCSNHEKCEKEIANSSSLDQADTEMFHKVCKKEISSKKNLYFTYSNKAYIISAYPIPINNYKGVKSSNGYYYYKSLTNVAQSNDECILSYDGYGTDTTFENKSCNGGLVNGSVKFDRENSKLVVNLKITFNKKNLYLDNSGNYIDDFQNHDLTDGKLISNEHKFKDGEFYQNEYSYDINTEIPIEYESIVDESTISSRKLNGSITNSINSNFSVDGAEVKDIYSESNNNIKMNDYSKVNNIYNNGLGSIELKGDTKDKNINGAYVFVNNIVNTSSGNIDLTSGKLNGSITNTGSGDVNLNKVTHSNKINIDDYTCEKNNDNILNCTSKDKKYFIKNNTGNITIEDSNLNFNSLDNDDKNNIIKNNNDDSVVGVDSVTNFDFINSNDSNNIIIEDTNIDFGYDYANENSNFITTPSNKTIITFSNATETIDSSEYLSINGLNINTPNSIIKFNKKGSHSNILSSIKAKSIEIDHWTYIKSANVQDADVKDGHIINLNTNNANIYDATIDNLNVNNNLLVKMTQDELVNENIPSQNEKYYPNSIKKLNINNNINSSSVIEDGLVNKIIINPGSILNINSGLILGKDKDSVIENNGTLIIGENDGKINQLPKIANYYQSENTLAINGNGNLKYYDGIIKASTSFSQNIIDLPDGYGINYINNSRTTPTWDEDYRKYYFYSKTDYDKFPLEQSELVSADKLEILELKTENDTKKYTKDVNSRFNDLNVFGNALKDINSTEEDNYEIKLLQSINITDGEFEIPSGKKITIDLNGKTLNASFTSTELQSLFINNGTITFKNGLVNIINNSNTNAGSIINNNKLNIENAYLNNIITNNNELVINKTNNNAYYNNYSFNILNNINAKKCELNNINATVTNKSNLKVTGGEINLIDNNENSVAQINSSIFNITGINQGSISFDDDAYGYIKNLTNNGTIKSNNNTIYDNNIVNNNSIDFVKPGDNLVYTNNNDNKTIIKGGENLNINNTKGNLEINDAKINTIETSLNSNTTINNSTLTTINNSGTITLNKSNLKDKNLLNNGTINFASGNIDIDTLEGSGNLNLGTKDGKYNIDELTFDLLNQNDTSKINLYDGIIKDSNGVDDIKLNSIDDGDYIIFRKNNIIKLIFVGLDPNAPKPFILKSNNGKYDSISDAINDSQDKDEIELSDDFINFEKDNDTTQLRNDFTIPEGKEITLDLKYFTFFTTITNNGTLIFNTNAEEKRTYSENPENEYYKDAIVPTITNNGNLVVNNGTYYHMRVINNSNYTIKDGAFRSQYITNNANSNLTIDDGDYSSFILENKEGANAIVNNGLFVRNQFSVRKEFGYQNQDAFINSRDLTINNMKYLMDNAGWGEYLDLIKHPGFKFYQDACGIFKYDETKSEYNLDNSISKEECIKSNYPEYNDENVKKHDSKYLKNYQDDFFASVSNIVNDNWDDVYIFPYGLYTTSNSGLEKRIFDKKYSTLFDNRDNGNLTINNGQFGSFNSNETKQDFSLYARDNSTTNLNGGIYVFEQDYFDNYINLTGNSVFNTNGGTFYLSGSATASGAYGGIINPIQKDLSEHIIVNLNGGDFYTSGVGYKRMIKNPQCLESSYKNEHNDECRMSNYIHDDQYNSFYGSLINPYAQNVGNIDFNFGNINVYNLGSIYTAVSSTMSFIDGANINFNFDGGNYYTGSESYYFYENPCANSLYYQGPSDGRSDQRGRSAFLMFGNGNDTDSNGKYKVNYTVNVNDINFNGLESFIYNQGGYKNIEYKIENGKYYPTGNYPTEDELLKININGGTINSTCSLYYDANPHYKYLNGALNTNWPLQRINIGKIDGSASDGPIINTPALSNSFASGNSLYANPNNDIKYGMVNFYDGTLINFDTYYKTYGHQLIEDIEPGYMDITKTTTDTYSVGVYNPNENKVTNMEIGGKEYTKLYKMDVADEAYVFSVNDNHFTNLQEAINYVQDTGDITMSSDYIMPEDITIPNGKNINIITNNYKLDKNNHTIINNGVFTIDGADASNLLGNILRTNTSKGTNIVLTTLNNGNNLEFNGNYKLYKYIDNDYKVINTKEVTDNSGRYIINDDNKDSYMNTINGRLYLNNIESGKYKVLDKDNNEITFSLDDKGKLQGNAKINYSNKDNSLVASSTASVLVQIRTGKTIINYALILVLIVITITGLIIVNKKKEN